MPLAISVEIHAAIVGGLISGTVVLLGVFLAEWLREYGDRKRQLREDVLELVSQLAEVGPALTGKGNAQRDAEWATHFKRVSALSVSIQVAIEGLPRWRRNIMREDAKRFQAKLIALLPRTTALGGKLSEPEFVVVVRAAAQLREDLGGASVRVETLTDEVAFLVANGLGAKPPSPS